MIKGESARCEIYCRVDSPWVSYYLGEAPLYPLDTYRNVLPVPRCVFHRMHREILRHLSHVWKRRVDRFHKQGIRSEVRVLTCIRMLGSGDSLRGMDDQGQIGREATRTYMKHFYRKIREILGPATSPIPLYKNSCMKFLRNMERCGFLGMLVRFIA